MDQPEFSNEFVFANAFDDPGNLELPVGDLFPNETLDPNFWGEIVFEAFTPGPGSQSTLNEMFYENATPDTQPLELQNLLIPVPEHLQSSSELEDIPEIQVTKGTLKKINQAAAGHDGAYFMQPAASANPRVKRVTRAPLHVIQEINAEQQPKVARNKRKQGHQFPREDGVAFFDETGDADPEPEHPNQQLDDERFKWSNASQPTEPTENPKQRCEGCSKLFKNLENHNCKKLGLENEKPERKLMTCECGKSYKTKKGFKDHILKCAWKEDSSEAELDVTMNETPSEFGEVFEVTHDDGDQNSSDAAAVPQEEENAGVPRVLTLDELHPPLRRTHRRRCSVFISPRSGGNLQTLNSSVGGETPETAAASKKKTPNRRVTIFVEPKSDEDQGIDSANTEQPPQVEIKRKMPQRRLTVCVSKPTDPIKTIAVEDQLQPSTSRCCDVKRSLRRRDTIFVPNEDLTTPSTAQQEIEPSISTPVGSSPPKHLVGILRKRLMTVDEEPKSPRSLTLRSATKSKNESMTDSELTPLKPISAKKVVFSESKLSEIQQMQKTPIEKLKNPKRRASVFRSVDELAAKTPTKMSLRPRALSVSFKKDVPMEVDPPQQFLPYRIFPEKSPSGVLNSKQPKSEEKKVQKRQRRASTATVPVKRIKIEATSPKVVTFSPIKMQTRFSERIEKKSLRSEKLKAEKKAKESIYVFLK